MLPSERTDLLMDNLQACRALTFRYSLNNSQGPILSSWAPVGVEVPKWLPLLSVGTVAAGDICPLPLSKALTPALGPLNSLPAILLVV